MIKEAIDRIVALSAHDSIELEGRLYDKGPNGFKGILPPTAETLVINTLTGIVDYAPDITKTMIHVIDHKNINLLDNGFINKWLTRSCYVSAVHESPVFQFGRYYDVEDFIIALQSMFVQDATTAMILALVGNIKDEGVTNFNDDGVTQQVTARTGISMLNNVPVPNPVTLRPYRTFMEVEQPASTFVFRVRGQKGEAPLCALFEADGRMWRLTAIKNIAEWLRKEIPGIKIIA